MRCVFDDVHGGSYDVGVDEVNPDADVSLVDKEVGIGTGHYVGAKGSNIGAGTDNGASNHHCDGAGSGNDGRVGQRQGR